MGISMGMCANLYDYVYDYQSFPWINCDLQRDNWDAVSQTTVRTAKPGCSLDLSEEPVVEDKPDHVDLTKKKSSFRPQFFSLRSGLATKNSSSWL